MRQYSEWETMKRVWDVEEIKDLMEQEEDILSYAMFPQVAPKYFEYRRAKLYGVDGSKLDSENHIHPV